MSAVTTSVGLIQTAQKVYVRKWSFLALFLLSFILTLKICMLVGFIPNPVTYEMPTLHGFTPSGVPQLPIQTSPLTASADNTQASAEAPKHPAPVDGSANMAGELPSKISIARIGLSATIANPSSTNIEKLDQYLLNGAVRYPTSATLGENGNVVLFGHSSYLPVVINQAYKTFDGIQKLKVGDEIVVSSNSHSYTYAVTSVTKQNVSSEQGIPLATNGAMLTLATCNSFGEKTDRFIVTAKLMGSSALGS